MKKTLLTIALVLMANIGVAQDDAYKADAMKVMKYAGSSASIDMAKKQILGMVPEAKQAAFIVEFEATIPALYDKLAAIYQKEYTHAELKEMLKFYEGPIGKRITEKSATIAEQASVAGQEWGQGLQAMMMKYMQ